MKILYIINSLCGGGAEKLMNDLLPRIKNTGYDCELLVLTLKDEKYFSSLTNQGIKVTEVPVKKKGHIARLNYIYKFIKKGKFDLVHANLFPVLYYCSLIKRFKFNLVPFVYTEHNTDNRRRHVKILRPIEKIIYKPFDCIISISNETQDSLLNWLKVDKKTSEIQKFHVIFNGVPLEEFHNALPYSREKILNSQLNNDYLMCMIGSLTEQKNHLFMLDVIKLLPDKFKLVLLGEGPLRKLIEMKNKELNLEKRVIMMGFQKDVASIIKACDLVVIPSKWEGFGLIAVEAMACGKPVICNDVPGLSEVVGKAGLRIEPGNVEMFKEGILHVASESNGKMSEVNCYKQAAKFSIDKMKQNYSDLYDALRN
jgi:glycosyltransferase involved in cell wall biosynthesis